VKLARAAAVLAVVVIALPASSNARRADQVSVLFWPAGRGHIEAVLESSGALIAT
jgi:hypothetical protein